MMFALLDSIVGPGAEGTADNNQLSQMVGVVVGNEESLSQDGLSVALRNRREQVRGRVSDQILHRLQIRTESLDASVPRGLIRRGVASGPVAFGERGRDVAGVAGKFQNVPLGDAHVL